MRRFGLVMAFVLAAMSAPPVAPAAAQVRADEPAAPAVVETEAVAPAEVGAGFTLPPRPAPPRTMEALWPVFVLFVVSWLGIIVYLLAGGRRVARLAARFEELEGER